MVLSNKRNFIGLWYILITMIFSCDGEAIYDPDLVVDRVFVENTKVELNQPVNIDIAFKNIAFEKKNLTKSSEVNEYHINIYRQEIDASGNTTSVFVGRTDRDNLAVLPADEIQGKQGEIEFFVSGAYYIEGEVDVGEVVVERDEDNNFRRSTDDLDARGKTKSNSGLIRVTNNGCVENIKNNKVFEYRFKNSLSK